MKTNILIGLMACILIYIGIDHYFLRQKVYFVRTEFLVENFKGTKDARELFERKFKDKTSSLDSMKIRYNLLLSDLQSGKTKPEKKVLVLVDSLRYQINSYSEYYSKIVQDEDEKMTGNVIKQVNAYINEYGRENKMDIILGTTNTGNILYGDSIYDISTKLLDGLNNKYKGE